MKVEKIIVWKHVPKAFKRQISFQYHMSQKKKGMFVLKNLSEGQLRGVLACASLTTSFISDRLIKLCHRGLRFCFFLRWESSKYSYCKARNMVHQLRQNRFVDQSARVLFIEMTFYSDATGLHTTAMFIFEFMVTNANFFLNGQP